MDILEEPFLSDTKFSPQACFCSSGPDPKWNHYSLRSSCFRMSHSCRESSNTENSINTMIHPREILGSLKLIFGSQVEAIHRFEHWVQWIWVLLMQSNTSLWSHGSIGCLDSVRPWESTAALGTTFRGVIALPIKPSKTRYLTAANHSGELGSIRHICFQDTFWEYNIFLLFFFTPQPILCVPHSWNQASSPRS